MLLFVTDLTLTSCADSEWMNSFGGPVNFHLLPNFAVHGLTSVRNTSKRQDLFLSFAYCYHFFLVLCLPRQVRTSNGAIHHDPQLSPSTCCNPLSASSPVTSFLVFLFS